MSSAKWILDCVNAHKGRIAAGKVAIHDWRQMTQDALVRTCWACGGTSRKLQKCHIIPRALGGSSAPGNIVPMCAICHDSAPDVLDGNEIWKWLEASQNQWTSFGLGRFAWIAEELKGYEAAITGNEICPVRFMEGLDIYLRQCGLHGGQNGQGVYLKKASIKWAIAKAFEPYMLANGQLNLF